ncbi:MAG: hypothetical protein M3Q79_00810 [bacterium]|nr:hypothetical protein [bacterium]
MTYSASVAMNRQRYTSRNHNSVSYRTADKRLGPITNSVVIIILACLLGMLYLTQVTHTNSLSYKIADLQERQSSLKTEREELEVTAARLQSIESFKSSQVASELVSVSPTAVVQ